MKYIMDSCVLLWFVMESDKLSPRARAIISDPLVEVFVSTVSLWELSLKLARGKLTLKNIEVGDLLEILYESGLSIIGLNELESSSFHRLSEVKGHRDFFDRMLIWQCITRGITLISNDTSFEAYRSFGLRLLW